MLKNLLLITLFIFINCILLISLSKILVENLNKKEEKKEDKKYINFYLIAENHATYEAFCQVTLNLDAIREVSKKEEISEEDKRELLKSMDTSLMELQNLLYDSQVNIPDPTVLTKSYLQNMIVKALEIRVFYEGLLGNIIVEETNNKSDEAKILKIVPSEINNGKL
jgi:hypothetical protein